MTDGCRFPQGGKGRSECMPVACHGPSGLNRTEPGLRRMIEAGLRGYFSRTAPLTGPLISDPESDMPRTFTRHPRPAPCHPAPATSGIWRLPFAAWDPALDAESWGPEARHPAPQIRRRWPACGPREARGSRPGAGRSPGGPGEAGRTALLAVASGGGRLCRGGDAYGGGGGTDIFRTGLAGCGKRSYAG